MTEITEAFGYLSQHPGGLTPGERDLIKSFQKYYKEHGQQLSERQRMTLLEIRKWREKKDQHIY